MSESPSTNNIDKHTQEIEMEVKREDLVDDDGDEKRVVDWMGEKEQIKFLFSHSYKGLKIEGPSGNSKTPYNKMSAAGQRYYIITDERILFLAKDKPESETKEIDYSDIGNVETNQGMTKARITLFIKDGRKISFWNAEPDYHDYIDSAGDYIKDKTSESDEQDGPYCVECGSELQGGEKFCPECGNDLTGSVCPDCSQYLSGIENYCPNCGSEVGDL